MRSASKLYRSALIAFAVLMAGLFCSGITTGMQTNDVSLDARLRADGNFVAGWIHFLESKLHSASSPRDVLGLMKSRSRDSGRIPLGGSGAYQLAFKLDDFIEIYVQFDGNDQAVAWSICRTIEGWLKDPDGYIVFSKSIPITTRGPLRAQKKRTDEVER